MLSEAELDRVWENLVGAEVRSLYFGSLAARYVRYKQAATGFSFLLSSGAAVSLAANGPEVLSLLLAVVSAAVSATSIALDLDRAAARMAKLHHTWSEIASDYERLWNHPDRQDAERVYDAILRRDRDASEAGTDAPYEPNLMDKWQRTVHSQRGLSNDAPAGLAR